MGNEHERFWPCSVEQRPLLLFLGFLWTLGNSKKTNEAEPSPCTAAFLRTALLDSLHRCSGFKGHNLQGRSEGDLRVSGLSGRGGSGAARSTRTFHQQFLLQFGVMLPHRKRVLCLSRCCKAINYRISQRGASSCH